MKRMKSDRVNKNWADTLQYVRSGGAVIIEHYKRVVAYLVPADDTIVVLKVTDAYQAQRLRRLVRDHGALGIPFPNNATSGLMVVDQTFALAPPGSIPSVAVQLATAEAHILIADVGVENAEWITTDPVMRARLHGEVTNLGEGRIRISADGHDILSELGESESADGQISDGKIWFEGDGYALTAS